MNFREELRQLVGEYRESWWTDAACKGLDPDLFFPLVGKSSRQAKAICAGCPVRTDCLAYALESREQFGIWGNKTEKERKAIRRNLPKNLDG